MIRLWFILSLCVRMYSQSWVQLPDFPGTKRDDGVAALVNNMAYFGTGLQEGWTATSDFYRLDPQNFSWTPIPDMPSGSQRQYACAFSGPGCFYVFGGDAGGALNTMFRFDVAANSWTQAASKPGAGLIGASCLCFGDRVIVAGGKIAGGGPANTEVWEYTLSSDAWLKKNDFPFEGRWRASAAVLNQKGYLMFGLDDSSRYRTEIYRYDHAGDQWTALPDFPHGNGRAYCALQATPGRLVLFGGHAVGNTYLNDVWYYSDSAAGWTPGPSLPATARRGDMSVMAGDKFIFSCGLGTGDTRLKETWMMDVPLSVSKFSSKSEFRVYPNPCNGLLRIRCGEASLGQEIRLCNLDGVAIQRAMLTSGINELDLRGLETGLYLMQVYDQGRLLHTEKIIRE